MILALLISGPRFLASMLVIVEYNNLSEINILLRSRHVLYPDISLRTSLVNLQHGQQHDNHSDSSGRAATGRL